MVAIKTHQAESFLRRPERRFGAVLFYGSDAGLVHERASVLARAAAARSDPPGELLRLDDADLESDPDRLGVELGTVPMFGGPKIIVAAAGRRITAVALKPLVGGEIEGMLIVEAGNLKPDDALRLLFEKSDKAAAVACFADGERDLAELIDDVLGEAKIGIDREARDLLLGRLGADRSLSRGELEKLALYAAGKADVSAEDVEAIVGDASELAMERIYSAAASGDRERAVRDLARALAGGESAQSVIAATQWHFQRLHRVRVAMDAGRSLDDALRQMRPPVHFKQRDAFALQCRLWSPERLAEALRRITATAKAARRTGAMEDVLGERLLLSLAGLARAGGGGMPR